MIHMAVRGLLQARFQSDAQALANFFTEDADCVNVVGWWWRGRPQIEKKVAPAHVFMFWDRRTESGVEDIFVFVGLTLCEVSFRAAQAKNKGCGSPKY